GQRLPEYRPRNIWVANLVARPAPLERRSVHHKDGAHRGESSVQPSGRILECIQPSELVEPHNEYSVGEFRHNWKCKQYQRPASGRIPRQHHFLTPTRAAGSGPAEAFTEQARPPHTPGRGECLP